MDKVQKIREELVRLYIYWDGVMQSSAATEAVARKNICKELLSFIDSMQEEPVNNGSDLGCGVIWKDEDLEEAAKHYLYSNILYDDVYVGNPTEKDCIEMFKAGAKLQKEQMMAKAVDGYVIEDIEEGNGDFLLSTDYLPKSMGLKDQQRVKVIVIKEE